MQKVSAGGSPQTKSSIASDLQRLGLAEGHTVIVHSSLSQIGYVLGGAVTVVRALIEVLGPRGTLVMPAFSPQVSDPASWSDRPFGEAFLELARSQVPAFDPATTPTSMGTVAETFRKWPGVIRSAHPQVSVAARGPLAARIVTPHELPWGQGTGSPFERLYELDAKLLLLGVGFNRATLLHFAESRVPHGRRKTRFIPVDVNGHRRWLSAPDVGDDLDTHFPRIGDELIRAGGTSVGSIGEARSILASSGVVVQFAVDYLSKALEV